MYKHLLIVFLTLAVSAVPMAKIALGQNNQDRGIKSQITSVSPKVLASPEEKLPAAKKSSGKYWIWATAGIVLVALAAGGLGGGGGDDSSPPADDSGAIEVEW